MIFGITLKHFAKLISQGSEVKNSKRVNRLLLKQTNRRFKTRSIQDLKFTDFVDLERFKEEQNYIEFCCIFVRKRFWQTIYVHNMFSILADFAAQKAELFKDYNYIFDPPQYGVPAPETIGSELRKDFVDEFGSYVVLMDLVCKGRIIDHKSIEQWPVKEFMFWANYLSGQKIVESVK